MVVAVKCNNFSLRIGPHPGEENTLIVLQAVNPRLLLYLPCELNLHSKAKEAHWRTRTGSGVRVGE